MKSVYSFFVGIDWASKTHQVCVIDPECKVIEQREIEHTDAGVNGLLQWFTKLTDGNLSKLSVAIETPRGALVESLLERGVHVFSINPKQLDRFRDRHTMAGAKDDRRDAFVLADSLRTDQTCFRLLQIDAPDVIRIREMSRVDDELRDMKYKLVGRLWHQIHRIFPGLLELCPPVDEPWFWALTKLACTPDRAAGVTRKTLAELLKLYRIKRHTADNILAVLRTPRLRVAPGTMEAVALHIDLLIDQLQLIDTQRRANDKQIRALLREIETAERGLFGTEKPGDVQILLSMPGIGHLITATLLAEAAQPLATRDYPALRAHTGIAPVTKRSGSRHMVVMRRACNTRLRNALYHWARVAMQRDAQVRLRYAALRKKGHTHPRAIRTLSDSLLRTLFGMLKSQTLFDPSLTRRVPPDSLEPATA